MPPAPDFSPLPDPASVNGHWGRAVREEFCRACGDSIWRNATVLRIGSSAIHCTPCGRALITEKKQ